MSDKALIQAGAIGGLLAAVVCCAAPLIVAVGSLGIGTALANGAYRLIPILAVVLALAGWHLYRRRASAQPCCNDKSFKEGVKS
jgi:hypothetical protein